MKVLRFNSNKEVLISTRKYLIDWENDGASKLEVGFRNLIYPYWKNSIILFQCRIPGSLLRIDFLNCNKRLAVEIDGEQHNSFNKHFHSNSRTNYEASLKRDNDKEKWLERNNIKILHLIKEDLDNFSIDYIYDKFQISLI